MLAQIKPTETTDTHLINNVSPYIINENFLFSLGFKKSEALSTPEEWVYRYYNYDSGQNGIELQYVYEFGILSIDEFWQNPEDNDAYFPHVIVGKFKIGSDDDLFFIFSRNVRLNYIFNIAKRRL